MSRFQKARARNTVDVKASADEAVRLLTASEASAEPAIVALGAAPSEEWGVNEAEDTFALAGEATLTVDTAALAGRIGAAAAGGPNSLQLFTDDDLKKTIKSQRKWTGVPYDHQSMLNAFIFDPLRPAEAERGRPRLGRQLNLAAVQEAMGVPAKVVEAPQPDVEVQRQQIEARYNATFPSLDKAVAAGFAPKSVAAKASLGAAQAGKAKKPTVVETDAASEDSPSRGSGETSPEPLEDYDSITIFLREKLKTDRVQISSEKPKFDQALCSQKYTNRAHVFIEDI